MLQIQCPNLQYAFIQWQWKLKKFLSQFNDVCIINNWRAIEIKSMWLKICLSKRACNNLYNCADFDTLITRLHSRFGDHLMKQKYEMSLPSWCRHQREKLFHLAADICRTVNIVYDELHPATRERIAVKHFIMALNSPSAQYELSQYNFETSIKEQLGLGSTSLIPQLYMHHQTVNKKIINYNCITMKKDHHPAIILLIVAMSTQTQQEKTTTVASAYPTITVMHQIWNIYTVIRSVPLLGATRLTIPRPGGPLWLATLCPGGPCPRP